jgi:hypothetical protein
LSAVGIAEARVVNHIPTAIVLQTDAIARLLSAHRHQIGNGAFALNFLDDVRAVGHARLKVETRRISRTVDIVDARAGCRNVVLPTAASGITEFLTLRQPKIS